MTASIDRRRVLQLLSALSGLVLVSRVAAAADTECATWLSEELEEDAIEALGREYLAGRATVPGLDRIASLIESADADVALDKLQKLMQDDYANDRIVNLSGWFVSVTEAQVFAVLAKCAA